MVDIVDTLLEREVDGEVDGGGGLRRNGRGWLRKWRMKLDDG